MTNENTVTPSDAVLAVVVTFVLLIFVGGASFILLGYGPASIISELLVIVVPVGYMLSKHINIKKYARIEITRRAVVTGVAFGGVLLLFDFVVSALVTAIFGTSQAVADQNKMITDLSRSSWGLLSVGTALVLAGVCEEFTFRAFLLNSINRRYSFIPALIISSFAFGLLHLDPQIVYVISTFLLGLVLGYIYHRYTYVACAIAHSTLNVMVLIILVLASL